MILLFKQAIAMHLGVVFELEFCQGTARRANGYHVQKV